MNLHDPKHPWNRLVAAARLATDDRDLAAPYGFATRVVALAQDLKVGSLLDRLALRAVTVACLLALVSVAVNYPTLAGGSTGALTDDSEVAPNDDAVAVVLDLTD